MKNKKSFIIGFLVGFILCAIIFLVVTTLQEKNTPTKKATVTGTDPETSVKKEAKEVKKENSAEGTLSNPLPFGKEGVYTDSDFLTEENFSVKIKIDEFQEAAALENFEPSFYNNLSLKDNHTYYGLKLTLEVIDGSNKDAPYSFDVLNNMKIYVDGAEASDNVMDMDLTDYSGIDGNFAIGASKTGWAGFQVPSEAKSIIAQVGGYDSNYYITLK